MEGDKRCEQVTDWMDRQDMRDALNYFELFFFLKYTNIHLWLKSTKVLRFGTVTFVNAHNYVLQYRHRLTQEQGGEVERPSGSSIFTYFPAY